MKIIRFKDEEYPENLRKIAMPPKQLYVLGDEKLLKERCISIIGSRVCSEKGRITAEDFAKTLSKAGLTIVSGMAKGIDTGAHMGTINANGKTIAVLGSGFKHIFPEENKELFYKIINKGGAVVSEYDEDVDVLPQRFVERNRIVSGLAEGVFIVEAKVKSGTSITAEFARRQKKKVFCLAHGIEEKEGIGTNRLIKKGAKLVTCPEDILEELKINVKISKEKCEDIKIEEITIPEEYIPVYRFITEKPINIDELYKKTKIDIGNINYILTMLELEGLIKQLPGKNFVR